MKRILLLMVLLVSCKPKESPLDKSIIEPLTLEELRAEVERDSLFVDNYDRIDRMRERIEKAKYSDVTYRQVNEYLNWWRDTTNLNQFWRESDMAWDKKYGNVVKRIDSTIAYWEEYYKRKGYDKSSPRYPSEAPFVISNYFFSGGFSKGRVQQDVAEQVLDVEFEFKDDMFGYRHDSIAIADYGKVGELFLINR